jgi:hypothetical protein
MKYRNRIPEPGTTISGFADKKKYVTVNTHIYFFWPYCLDYSMPLIY